MKAKLLVIASIFFLNLSWSQSVIFSENMGSPSGQTLLVNNTFQNSGLFTYSNGAQATSADIRPTSPSSTYYGASGNGNVWFAGSNTTYSSYGFAIEGINASNYNTLKLYFGYKKEAAASHANFAVDYWNGTSWINLGNSSSALFFEAASAPAVWYMSKWLSLPSDAQINGLKLRFVKTGSTAIRIDDVVLIGTETLPSVTNTAVAAVTTNSVTFSGNVTATGGSPITATGTIYALTTVNSTPGLGGTGVTVIGTPTPNSGTGSFSNVSGTTLSANIQYSYNAYATKSTGLTGYGSAANFYTLALTPTVPIVDSPSGTSLNVTIGNDSNPTHTTYSIRETTSNKYVQADGTLNTTAVYKTASNWATKTVIGLSSNTTYSFQTIAKNGDGILTLSSTSASGTTLNLPSITISGTLTALNTTYGSASSNTSFSFTANNLTDDVIITAPTGFEISKTAGGISGYASSHTIVPVSGVISTTIIYIRLAAVTSYGIYSGNITLVSAHDILTVNVPIAASTVAKLTASISGVTALSKAYNGNTITTLTGTAVVNGILSTDTNNAILSTTSVSANFADSDIGVAKPVTVTGYTLTGSSAANYDLVQPTGLIADITSNTNSDVILNGSSPASTNSDILYAQYQGTTLTNTGTGSNGSAGVMGFYVRDGAGSIDADSLPTELKAITFSVGNSACIKSARLFVGSSPRGLAVDVSGASTITFTGLTNIIANDNDQIAVNLRVTFMPNVTDNVQMQFKVVAVTAGNNSSTFASSNGGGAITSMSNHYNQIEVVAASLHFATHPPSMDQNSIMNPFPTVVAIDQNGMIDLDSVGAITVTSSGALTGGSQTQTGFNNNGIYEFNNISHTSAGTGLVLTASFPGLTSGVSNPFNVNTTNITPTFGNIGPICSGRFLSLPVTSTNGITGSWSPVINNMATTTYTFTPNQGQDAAPTTKTVTVNPTVTPTFNAVSPITAGGTISPLPLISTNGYSGYWSPALDNSTTTTYLFTPTATNTCITTAVLTVVVIEPTVGGSAGTGGTTGTSSQTAQKYHDTQGKLEVSNSGSAVYSLPIALPPSIQDVGPTVNLVYNSGQMGGIVGQGWSINTISNISRISTRKDIDGFIDGVDFDVNDKLALDGQRLLLVSGTYWSAGSTYQTETQSNSKIELFGAGTNMYFIVTTPDGSRAWYGNYGGMNASDLTAYYINRFEDTNTNFITYEYTKPFAKSLCLTKINFSGNVTSGIAAQNSVNFHYIQAQRKENYYINGLRLEKVELLDKVEVFTNGQAFRSYNIEHSIDPELGYQQVSKITELNGAGEEANPLIYSYLQTSSTNVDSEVTKEYTNNIEFEDVELSGDFDGDGRLDFVTDNEMFLKVFEGNTGNTPVNLPIVAGYLKKDFVATTLNNNRLNQYQTIIKPLEHTNSIEFKYYGYNPSSNTVELQDSKTFSFDNVLNCYENCEGASNEDTFHPCSGFTVNKNNKYFEGDFNGDGISEVLVFKFPETRIYGIDMNNCNNSNKNNNNNTAMQPIDPECVCEFVSDNVGEFGLPTLFNLDHNASTAANGPGAVSFVNMNFNRIEDRLFVSDFNSDGKSDVLIIKKDKSYKLYSFNQLNVSPWIEYEILGEGSIDRYGEEKAVLLGDYNGDGKTDLLLPDSDLGGSGQDTWHIYYSNPNPGGGAFFVKETHQIVEYRPNTGTDYQTQVHVSNYYALDVNKDGKSDLVRVWRKYYKPSWTINDHDTQWKVTSFVNNIGNGTLGFTPDYVTPCVEISGNDPHTGEPIVFQNCNHNSDWPGLAIPIVSTYRHNNLNRELVMVANHQNEVTYIKFTKDVSSDILINKITSSGGNIVDEIRYKTLEPSSNNNGLGLLSDFYSSDDSVTYPYVEIKRVPSKQMVYQLTNASMEVVKRQEFKYHGYVVNMDGMGAIGFRKIARSSWFDATNAKRIWGVAENNPILRGANIRNYSELINTGGDFSFVTTGNPTGIINSTVNTYTSNVTNGLFTIYLNTQITEDFMTSIKKEATYTYLMPYILEGTVITKNYLSGVLQKTNTIVKEYDPPVTASPYCIGRPNKMTSTIDAYGDISVAEEKFFYSGYLLTKNEKKADNTDGVYLTEEIEYYPNGNVKKKILSAPGASPSVSQRVTEFTYDSSERFIKTSKDIEGLITVNNSFHSLYGSPLMITNPYGLTSENVYDNWGKRIKENNYLGKSTYYTYSKSNGFYTTQELGEDGSIIKSISDALGRVIRKGRLNINGVMVYSDTEYDFMNRKSRESQPFFSGGSATQWNAYTYDEYNRLKTTTDDLTGLTTTVNYAGLSTTVSNGNKTTSTIKNANGHIVSTSDDGGTIINTYFANGNLKTTSYDSTTLQIEYDGWGHKKKLIDPSAGTYEYLTNIYGEVYQEKSPNGRTDYNLSALGKLNYKTISDTSGSTIYTKTSYTYDSASKLLVSERFDDFVENHITNYTYQYDEYRRLVYSEESSNFTNFKETTEYDALGRPSRQRYSALNVSDGSQSDKWVINTYKNGCNWQILDTANQVLWQANTVDARGQILTATFGNGINVTNTYDQYGFLSQSKHEQGAVNIMTLDTSFERETGNLVARYNSLFNRTEEFHYDNLDRLTDYPNASGDNVHQAYETDGRIKDNNLGVYSYESARKYRNNAIVLSDNNVPYFGNRSGIFNDDMESGNGWDINDPTVVTFDSTTSKTGTQSIKIHNTTSGEKVVQSTTWTKIDNVAATNYTYSGWVKSTGPDAEMFLYMKSANETAPYTQADQIISTPGTSWIYFEKTVLVPANIKLLSLRLDNNATGTVWFDDVRIRKTDQVDNYVRELNVNYNGFKSPIEITETNVDKISFEYNHSNSRSSIYYGGLETDKMQRQYRKHYSDDGVMEIKQNMLTGEVEFITYIGGDGYTAPLVLKKNASIEEYLYLHRDYQGSILAVTNQAGVVVEKRLFDAWGAVLKVEDELGNSLAGFAVLDRGYTGHEHLQSVGLVNMNGRLYDPKVHRFMQPDNNIQDVTNTQNFNRYGYVLNNPLKYTDPSGEEFLTAVIIATAIAMFAYTITALTADVPFTMGGLLQTAAIGAFTGAVTFGVGTTCSTITNFYIKATAEAIANGMFQGSIAGLQGGNYWNAMASAAASSLASSFWKGGTTTETRFDYNHDLSGGHFVTDTFNHQGLSGALGMNNSWGTLVFGTVSGGAGAELTGGNFWQGAVTGLIVSGLNHGEHPDSGKGIFEWTNDYTKIPLTTEQSVTGYSFTGWINNAADSELLTLAAGGIVGGAFTKAGAMGQLGVSWVASKAMSYTSQFNIKYANVTETRWYGKVTYNVFTSNVTDVEFVDQISVNYKVPSVIYNRVLNNLTNLVIRFSSSATIINQYIPVIHNPVPRVGMQMK